MSSASLEILRQTPIDQLLDPVSENRKLVFRHRRSELQTTISIAKVVSRTRTRSGPSRNRVLHEKLCESIGILDRDGEV